MRAAGPVGTMAGDCKRYRNIWISHFSSCCEKNARAILTSGSKGGSRKYDLRERHLIKRLPHRKDAGSVIQAGVLLSRLVIVKCTTVTNVVSLCKAAGEAAARQLGLSAERRFSSPLAGLRGSWVVRLLHDARLLLQSTSVSSISMFSVRVSAQSSSNGCRLRDKFRTPKTDACRFWRSVATPS